MADNFDTSICSGSWWNTARISSSSSGFDASDAQASATCSSAITDAAGGSAGVAFSWISAATADVEPHSSISSFGLSPNPSLNWNQSLLGSTERDESSFHGILQEPLNYEHQINQQQFLLGQRQQSGFPVMLHQSIYDQRLLSYNQPGSLMMGNNYQSSATDSFANFTQLLKSSPPKQQQRWQQQTNSTANNLHFSNNTPVWNPSAPPSAPVQLFAQNFEPKPNWSNITTKSNTDSAMKKSSSSSEASLKKLRIETPSPLPTFKIRKEKLGDRITALQQLVSPFGKTDTASVLQEAIDYIKFLQDQVNMLSAPYLKNGNSMQHQQNSDKSKDGEGSTKQDLRSRGLCLVPMESIYTVASETAADFWTPTFGGTYR